MGFSVLPFGKEDEVQSLTFFLILIATAMTQKKKSNILYFLFLLKMERAFRGALYSSCSLSQSRASSTKV